MGAVQLQGRPGLIGGKSNGLRHLRRQWIDANHLRSDVGRPVGRPEAPARARATDAFVRTCGGEASAVRVLIRDVAKTDWAVGGELVADRDEPS